MTITEQPAFRARMEARLARIEAERDAALYALGMPSTADMAAIAALIVAGGEAIFPGQGEQLAALGTACDALASAEEERRLWETAELPPAPEGEIFTIEPYPYRGGWVFDDPARGLWREPLAIGTEAILDRATATLDGTITDGVDGRRRFRLHFSAKPFAGADRRLDHRNVAQGGNWYSDGGQVGWLCPALYTYFGAAPPVLHIGVESMD